MSEDCNYFKCELCDYKTKKKFNMTRHMVRIHIASNVSPTSTKGMILAQKSMILAQKSMIDAPKSIQVYDKGTLLQPIQFLAINVIILFWRNKNSSKI